MASKWPEEDFIALADQEENQSEDEDLTKAAKSETITNSDKWEDKTGFDSIFQNQDQQKSKGVSHASSISDQVN